MTAAAFGRRLAIAAPAGRWQAGKWGPGPIPVLLGCPLRSTGALRPVGSEARAPEPSALAESPDGDEPGDAVSVTGVRVYRHERPAKHRTFRWGVGNRFRMINANRFSPVHLERKKEVSVREDYFESDNPNIKWEDLNETWEVYWYEHSKLNAKPFPVKKFGIELSKTQAFAFYEELERDGRLGKKREHDRSHPGIFFDERFQDWVSFAYRDGRPISRTFSATKFGYEGAKSLALAKQRDPVGGVLPLRRASDGPKREWERKMSESDR